MSKNESFADLSFVGGEEESHAHMVLEGTSSQIAAAKAVLEQKLIMAIGAAKMERLQI